MWMNGYVGSSACVVCLKQWHDLNPEKVRAARKAWRGKRVRDRPEAESEEVEIHLHLDPPSPSSSSSPICIHLHLPHVPYPTLLMVKLKSS